MTLCGMIIKETKFGENDKIITILTAQGKLQAVAKGARNYKSRLMAGSQLFCYSSICLQRGRGELPFVCDCEVIRNFYNLRLDIKKLALASYFAELLCVFAIDASNALSATNVPDEPFGDVLSLALNSLYILEKNDDCRLVKAVFELRLMALLGFAPMAEACVICGDRRIWGFSATDSGMLCEKCGGAGQKRGKQGMLVYGASKYIYTRCNVIAAIRHIIGSDSKKVFAFKLPAAGSLELARACEEYVISNLGRRPKALDYFMTISCPESSTFSSS